MLTQPMDVLEQFPVRKSKKRKQEFRQEVSRLLESYGYTCHEERGSMGAVNLVAGDPERAKYLITAHYDTCARMLVPNFITPCNAAIYLLYQLVLVLGIVGGSALLGIGAGILTGSPGVGELVYLVCLFGILYLMMAGPANPTNANDNTSGVVTLLEIAERCRRTGGSRCASCCLIWRSWGLWARLPIKRRIRRQSGTSWL